MPKKITTTKVAVKKTATKKVAKKAPVSKKVVKKATTTKVAKKAPAKVSAKKAGAKKNSSVKSVIYTDNGTSFWVTDGQILNSLIALHSALLDMEDNIFDYHVNSEKNDFAEWVDCVLCDGDCASDLRKVDSPKEASSVVAKHLKSYKG